MIGFLDGIFRAIAEGIGLARDKEKRRQNPIGEQEAADEKARAENDKVREAMDPEADVSEIQNVTRYRGKE